MLLIRPIISQLTLFFLKKDSISFVIKGILILSCEYIKSNLLSIEFLVSGLISAKHLSSNSLCIPTIPKRSAKGAKISRVS